MPSRKKRANKNKGIKKKREGVLSAKKRAQFQNKKTRGQRPQFRCQIFARPQSIYAYLWYPSLNPVVTDGCSMQPGIQGFLVSIIGFLIIPLVWSGERKEIAIPMFAHIIYGQN